MPALNGAAIYWPLFFRPRQVRRWRGRFFEYIWVKLEWLFENSLHSAHKSLLPQATLTANRSDMGSQVLL